MSGSCICKSLYFIYLYRLFRHVSTACVKPQKWDLQHNPQNQTQCKAHEHASTRTYISLFVSMRIVACMIYGTQILTESKVIESESTHVRICFTVSYMLCTLYTVTQLNAVHVTYKHASKHTRTCLSLHVAYVLHTTRILTESKAVDGTETSESKHACLRKVRTRAGSLVYRSYCVAIRLASCGLRRPMKSAWRIL